MTIRPYPAWGLLAAVLAASAWRLADQPAARFAVAGRDAPGWASLARLTPEELERGVAHRYAGLAPELGGARDVGYFTDADWDRLWATQAGPEGHVRIERYYMAQAMLPPSVLRYGRRHPLVVVDCATPEQAGQVLGREGLAAIRNFGGGLVLARPGAD